MHRLQEVDEFLASCPREHGHGLPREPRCRHFLDEVQENPMLDPLSEQEGLDEGRGAKGRAHDGDAVFIRPLPVDVRVRLVRQVAAVWNKVHLEGERRVPGCRFQELSSPVASKGLNENHVLLRLGREAALLPCYLGGGFHDFPYDLRGS